MSLLFFALTSQLKTEPATDKVIVNWSAPPVCTQQEQFKNELLASIDATPRQLEVKGRIGERDSEFILELDAARPEIRPWHWSLKSAHCIELVEAARVVLTMYVQGRTPTPVARIPLIKPVVSSRAVKSGVAVSLQFGGLIGPQPSVALGPLLKASLVLSRARVTLGVGYGSQSSSQNTTTPYKISLASLPIHLSGTFLFQFSRFSVGPTVGADAAVLFSSTTGLATNETNQGFFLGFGAGFGSTLQLYGPLFLTANATFGFSAVRPNFIIKNSNFSFASMPYYGSFAVGMELLWQ